MRNTIAFVLIALFLGIASCSKGPEAAAKPNEKMAIPKGFPGGPPENPKDR